MKRIVVIILVIIVVLGMSASTILVGLGPRTAPETNNPAPVYNESPEVSEQNFSGPSGDPQVTGPSAPPGQ